MKEYIEREAALACKQPIGAYGMDISSEDIKAIHAADVVEVVRCKDCGYSYDSVGGLCCSHGVCVDCVVPEDFFCRYGKRKGGDE